MKHLFIFLAFSLLTCLASAQNIGIGTSTPAEKLEVNGGIKLGHTSVNNIGTMRWNPSKEDFEGYVGDGRWLSFTGGKSQWGNIEQYATESGGMYGQLQDTSFGEPISYHNNKLAIAIPNAENGIYEHSGKVLVMNLSSSGNVGNQYTLYPPVYGDHYFFGKSASVFNSELVVGMPGISVDGNTQQGKAYVYKLNSQNQPGAPQELPQTGINGDPFDKYGSTVAIAGDLIAVAAPEKAVGNNAKQGRVYTFIRLYLFGQPTDAFVPDMNFTAPDGIAQMQFGKTIDISTTCMAIGAPHTTVNGDANAGKVYIYRRQNNTWQYEAAITPPNSSPNTYFGSAVSINAAGDTLIVGAPRSSSTGYAVVYRKNGANWQYVTTFESQDGNINGFGCAVDFLNGRVLIGSRTAKVGINTYQGKAHLYNRTTSGWTREAMFTPQNGEANLFFGASVQLSPTVAVVSAPGYLNTFWRTDRGRVYWFVKS